MRRRAPIFQKCHQLERLRDHPGRTLRASIVLRPSVKLPADFEVPHSAMRIVHSTPEPAADRVWLLRHRPTRRLPRREVATEACESSASLARTSNRLGFGLWHKLRTASIRTASLAFASNRCKRSIVRAGWSRSEHSQSVLQDRRGRSRIFQECDRHIPRRQLPHADRGAYHPVSQSRPSVASKSVRVSAARARPACRFERNSVSRCSPTH